MAYIIGKDLIALDTSEWTSIDISMPYSDMATEGVLTWLHENVQGDWSILGLDKIIFEDGCEALTVRMKFNI